MMGTPGPRLHLHPPPPQNHHQKGTPILDTITAQIFLNSLLDIVWPLLPAQTLEQLAYV